MASEGDSFRPAMEPRVQAHRGLLPVETRESSVRVRVATRSDANGWGLMNNAAHPGASTTDLITNGPGPGTWILKLNAKFVSLIGHSAAAGALPTLFAATSPDAKPAGYYGPNGILELKGAVAPAVVSPKAKDVDFGRYRKS
jgi:hypothetical protein